MKNTAIMALLAMFGLVVASTFMARADDDEMERVPAIKSKLVKDECGACHMAFQPAFLPQASWKKIMAGLSDHFGEDASLDEDSARKIEQYLLANARRGRVRGEPPLRITGLRWFVREHRKEVSPRARQRAKTMANCKACHRGAEAGYYEDD